MRRPKAKQQPKAKPAAKAKPKPKPKAKSAAPAATGAKDALFKRIHRELVDDFDEELEMERDDWEITEPGGTPKPTDADSDAHHRRSYFTELYRLQGELVKLHDWVAETGHRLVIICEGRDAGDLTTMDDPTALLQISDLVKT